jgi:hypothetical protein
MSGSEHLDLNELMVGIIPFAGKTVSKVMGTNGGQGL